MLIEKVNSEVARRYKNRKQKHKKQNKKRDIQTKPTKNHGTDQMVWTCVQNAG